MRETQNISKHTDTNTQHTSIHTHTHTLTHTRTLTSVVYMIKTHIVKLFSDGAMFTALQGPQHHFSVRRVDAIRSVTKHKDK